MARRSSTHRNADAARAPQTRVPVQDDLHVLLAELLDALCGDCVVAVAVADVDAVARQGRIVATRGTPVRWRAGTIDVAADGALARVLASSGPVDCAAAISAGLPLPGELESTHLTACVLAGHPDRVLLGLVFAADAPARATRHAHALSVAREVARCLAGATADPGQPCRALEDLASRLDASAQAISGSSTAGGQVHAHVAALLQAFEDERALIGDSLQNSVMQSLAALKFGLEHSFALLQREDHAATVRVMRELVEQLRAIIDEVRTLGFRTRPPLLDDVGAVSAVQWLCREWADHHPDTRLELECALANESIPDGLKLPVFRTVQLALDNVARHARAPRVIVALNRNAHQLEVDIMDEGVGFHAQHAAPPGALGLVCLNERVNHSGGTARILSHPGRGTIVQARWPLSAQHETTHHA